MPPLPLLLVPPPPRVEKMVQEAARIEVETIPPALLRPLGLLFDGPVAKDAENFLAGLQAASFLGARALPATGKRRTPLAWVGIALRGGRNLFADLRGGCWVRGFPAVGRGRELLKVAGLADDLSFSQSLTELGIMEKPGSALYFNFHYDQPTADCARVYILDVAAERLHAFALPVSALAAGKGKG